MTDVYKQGVEAVALKKLEDALAEFVAKHPPGHPGIAQQIERAEGRVLVAMHTADEGGGTAVVGAASALLEFIRASSSNRMAFRKPYPME